MRELSADYWLETVANNEKWYFYFDSTYRLLSQRKSGRNMNVDIFLVKINVIYYHIVNNPYNNDTTRHNTSPARDALSSTEYY